MKAGQLSEPNRYAEHHDKTAAKGLCWECETNRANVYHTIVDGRRMRIESLWCLDCQVKLGFMQEAEGVQ